MCFTFVPGKLDVEEQVTPLFEMAPEISSSDSQVNNVQMFKLNIIYHRYRAVARKKLCLSRARQKLEFQLALRASKSQNLLSRANFPFGRV